MKMRMAALALAGWLVAGAAEASELATLQAKLRKYAPLGRPGAVCVCQSGGQFHGHAGHVGQGTNAPIPGMLAATASCAVPIFDADGRKTGGSGCRPFVVLAK
ncbi:MAG: hypothetical protein AB1689_28950 [Thermodesulfobacteriota bacterium]